MARSVRVGAWARTTVCIRTLVDGYNLYHGRPHAGWWFAGPWDPAAAMRAIALHCWCLYVARVWANFYEFANFPFYVSNRILSFDTQLLSLLGDNFFFFEEESTSFKFG